MEDEVESRERDASDAVGGAAAAAASCSPTLADSTRLPDPPRDRDAAEGERPSSPSSFCRRASFLCCSSADGERVSVALVRSSSGWWAHRASGRWCRRRQSSCPTRRREWTSRRWPCRCRGRSGPGRTRRPFVLCVLRVSLAAREGEFEAAHLVAPTSCLLLDEDEGSARCRVRGGGEGRGRTKVVVAIVVVVVELVWVRERERGERGLGRSGERDERAHQRDRGS